MRRYALLFGLFILACVGTYAKFSMSYVADTVMPRVPRYQVGTLGYLFEKILGVGAIDFDSNTGLVVNTSHLGGRTRDEYLKAGSPTCGVGEAWTAIDTSGVAICSPVGAPASLAMIGNAGVFSGVVNIYRANQALPIAMTPGMSIMDGDIVQTASGGSAEIIFTDDSVIRLSSDSTLSLNIGSNLGEGQIAQIILQNGNLWGRILSQTGVYNIGTDDIVAAVRGTSLALTKTGVSFARAMFTYNSSTSSGWSINKVIPSERTPPMTTLTVVDSSLGLRRGVVQIDCLRDSTAVSMDVEQKFVTDGKCNGQSPTTATAATLYASTDDWIKKNTMKDIDYLGNLLYVSGTIGPDGNPTGRTNTLTGGTEKQDKIQAEFQASTPVPGPETANLCPSSDEWNAKYGGCVPRRMIAFADYRNGNLNFRYKDNTKPDIPGINSGGMIIFDPQNRRNGIYLTGATAIKYNPINILSGFSLREDPKNIIIELVDPIKPSGDQYLLTFNVTAFRAYYDGLSPYCKVLTSIISDCPVQLVGMNRYKIPLTEGLWGLTNLDFGNYFPAASRYSLRNTIRTIFLTE